MEEKLPVSKEECLRIAKALRERLNSSTSIDGWSWTAFVKTLGLDVSTTSCEEDRRNAASRVADLLECAGEPAKEDDAVGEQTDTPEEVRVIDDAYKAGWDDCERERVREFEADLGHYAAYSLFLEGVVSATADDEVWKRVGDYHNSLFSEDEGEN